MFANLPAICVKLKKLHIKKSSGAKLTLNCINRKRWNRIIEKRKLVEFVSVCSQGKKFSNSKVKFYNSAKSVNLKNPS